jgi:DNA modification methylase
VNAPLVLRAADLVAQRPDGTVDDIHFTEALAESIIRHTTDPGDVVLDPFAGYGTTLAVAEKLGRRAVGVELRAEHVEIARTRIGSARLIHGDARRLGTLVHEAVDLVFTSPPYMAGVDHPENPLTGYTTDDGDYATYLSEIGDVFAQAAALLRPGGQAVINVGNPLAPDGRVTPLATDLAEVIGAHLTLLGTTALRWDEPPAGLDGDYLLWFRRESGGSP